MDIVFNVYSYCYWAYYRILYNLGHPDGWCKWASVVLLQLNVSYLVVPLLIIYSNSFIAVGFVLIHAIFSIKIVESKAKEKIIKFQKIKKWKKNVFDGCVVISFVLSLIYAAIVLGKNVKY